MFAEYLLIEVEPQAETYWIVWIRRQIVRV